MNMSKSFLHNCPAPAKLNLFLHVTGQRPDGYHLLQSVFQLIDLCDILHFDRRDDSQIRRLTDNDQIREEDDLVIRAAKLLQKAASNKKNGFLPGVDIRIEKNIPMGGGLGGGCLLYTSISSRSSDRPFSSSSLVAGKTSGCRIET